MFVLAVGAYVVDLRGENVQPVSLLRAALLTHLASCSTTIGTRALLSPALIGLPQFEAHLSHHH